VTTCPISFDRGEREHERVVVTRNGRPAAVLIGYEDLGALEETLEIPSDGEAGHFARHLRRMRSLYAQWQQWLIEAATRLGDRIRLQPSDGGLHLVGWLPTDVNDYEVAKQALRHQVQVWPLSQNYLTRAPRPEK